MRGRAVANLSALKRITEQLEALEAARTFRSAFVTMNDSDDQGAALLHHYDVHPEDRQADVLFLTVYCSEDGADCHQEQGGDQAERRDPDRGLRHLGTPRNITDRGEAKIPTILKPLVSSHDVENGAKEDDDRHAENRKLADPVSHLRSEHRYDDDRQQAHQHYRGDNSGHRRGHGVAPHVVSDNSEPEIPVAAKSFVPKKSREDRDV